MEQEILDLVRQMSTKNVVQEGSFIGWDKSENDYYVIKAESCHVRFWNSSNQQAPYYIPDIVDRIREELLDGEDGGEFSDGWNQIMWEVVYE